MLLAAAFSLLLASRPTLDLATMLPLGLISFWGFAQLALGSTVYRYATLDAAVRFASYGAAGLLAAQALHDRSQPDSQPDRWMRWFSWFGAAVALVSVLAYYTSPEKLLWLVASRYPDNWGPFESRNNFAQFLELAFPVAMYRLKGTKAPDSDRVWVCGLLAAAIFAAGLASASRAGSVLLTLEALWLGLVLFRGDGKRMGIFATAALGLVLAMGTGTLLGRLKQSDPLSMRREIFESAWSMTRAHPWTGFGLGTFAAVYPEYARFDPGSRVDHAHNDWLEWSAEGGVGLAGVWLALAVALIRRAVRSIWGLGVVAVLLHATVDYPFARFGVAVWFFALWGMLAVSGRELSGGSRL